MNETNTTPKYGPILEDAFESHLVTEIPKTIKKLKNQIYINANFGNEITEIGYIFLATGEQNVLSASNGMVHLLLGRMYYVPIGKNDIDSDDYNIKVHSDIADRFDVRYVKDGLAAVVPIRHNTILKNGEKLCVLTPL